MRVSAKAEYACVALLELAAGYGEQQPLRLKTIADQHGIPQRFLVQILLQLKGAGLVASVRGAAGGYQLARKPEEISIAEIVNLIDATGSSRSAPTSLPDSEAARALRSVWQEVHQSEQRILEKVTLADLVRRAAQSHGYSYQI